MRKYIFLVMILAIVGFVYEAEADIVCLTNGNILEGIIVQETDEVLELEVFLGAKITFTKDNVAYVKKWDEEKNQALREKWVKDREERAEADLARQEFQAQQKAKGLVKYRGKWIPKAEEEQLKTREYIDEVLGGKIDRGEIVGSGRRERTKIARALLAKASWHHRQTEHFIIYYEDVIQSKMVADRAEYYYEKIAYDLDYDKTIYWPEKCEIFIIPSEEKWQGYMEDLVPRYDHIGGFVPRTGEREIYLCARHEQLYYLQDTFAHELTHLIFGEFAQDEDIPLWLNEGLAIYESPLPVYADATLRDNVKEAKHIPLKEIVEMDDYPQTIDEMRLYYAQSAKMVEFLIGQHGRKKFSRFCRLLNSGQSFAKALNFVYGDKYYNQDEFNRAWIKYILR